MSITEFHLGKYCLLATSANVVFVGLVDRIEPVPQEGFRVLVRDCRMVIYWPSGGVQALVTEHRDGTRMGKQAEITILTHVTRVDLVTEEAETLHRNAPTFER